MHILLQSLLYLQFFSFIIIFYFTNTKIELLKIISLNILLSIPAIYFLVSKDFYLFVNEPFDVDLSTKYNFLIKSSLSHQCFFVFFTFISKRNIFFEKNFNFNCKLLIVLLFVLINIYFFNFLTRSGGGGGIFFQTLIFCHGNYILLFIIFSLSMLMFGQLNLFNFIMFFFSQFCYFIT